MPAPPGGPPPAIFSGRVETVATVTRLQQGKGGTALTLHNIPHATRAGDVLSLNGVCITVRTVDTEKSTLQCGMSQKTMANTSLGSLKIGSPVNVERWTQSDHLTRWAAANHYVRALPNTTCTLTAITPSPTSNTKFPANSLIYTFQLPNPTIPPLGDPFPVLHPGAFITVDGVALHVYDRTRAKGQFRCLLVPNTVANTALGVRSIPSGSTGKGDKKPGDKVNVEFNIVEVAALLIARAYRGIPQPPDPADVTNSKDMAALSNTIPEFLRERFSNTVAKRVSSILEREALERMVGGPLRRNSMGGGVAGVRADAPGNRRGSIGKSRKMSVGGEVEETGNAGAGGAGDGKKKWNVKLKL